MAKKKIEKVEKIEKRETEMDKIRKMDEVTILEHIADCKRELFNLRFQAALGKLEQTDKISKAKKTIARMKTVMTERANGAK